MKEAQIHSGRGISSALRKELISTARVTLVQPALAATAKAVIRGEIRGEGPRALGTFIKGRIVRMSQLGRGPNECCKKELNSMANIPIPRSARSCCNCRATNSEKGDNF